MIEDIKKDADRRMTQTIKALHLELAKLRSGRAHPSLLDHLSVDYYGSQVPLSQAASINVPDARTLSVTPFDKKMVPVIEKAIMESSLGLNPSTAGTVIRIPLPPLTEERRRDMIKLVRAEGEHARVAVRNVRRDANHMLKDLVKAKDISEDDERRGEEQVQQLTDTHIKEIDGVLDEKEKDLMEF